MATKVTESTKARPGGARLLVVDAGHSRLKFHLYQPGCAPRREALPVRPLRWPADAEFTRFDECLLMGTNARMHVRISSHLKQSGWAAPLLLGRDVAVPLVSLPAGAGNDRLAHAMGGAAEFPGENILLASAGTALVIDKVDPQGRFAGGLIGLGLARHLEAMAAISDKLVWDGGEAGPFPALDTSSAVYQGWLMPALACIERLRADCNCTRLVITGGDAAHLARHLPDCVLRPYLGADAMARALGYA